jgi:hypothetical protein
MRKTFGHTIRSEVYDAIERGDWCEPEPAAQPLLARDPKDLTLPTTTNEFAQWLRDIATQVDRIPDRPLQLDENDVEIGFYYGNVVFPRKPTGLHFEVSFATTEYAGRRPPKAHVK